MNRRDFLKTSATLATATYAGLRWTAPEKPPELVDAAEIGASIEPTWWAECSIDKKPHRAASFKTIYANNLIPDVEQEDAYWNFRNVVTEDSVVFRIWAEDGRKQQILELCKTRSRAHVSIIPENWTPFEDGAFLGGLEFDGYVTHLWPFPPDTYQGIPFVNVEFLHTGPIWRIAKLGDGRTARFTHRVKASS